jgi:hypothetical protein
MKKLLPLGLLLASSALAQPLGSEFRVNSYTTYDQRQSAVAADASGGFLVVWAGTPAGSTSFIYGQRYSSAGATLDGEFRVSAGTTREFYPSVAALQPGGFVVVWQGGSGLNVDVFGQRFDSLGAPLGGEFRVNATTTNYQRRPAVASDSAGNFVVVWQSRYQDGGQFGIFGQRFASSGTPLGGEFRVNTHTTTTGQQRFAKAASDAAGNFVVVWQTNYEDGSDFGIVARRYAASGAPLGGEIPINATTAFAQTHPAIASDPSGNLVIAWETDVSSSEEVDYRAGPDALRLGTALRANTYATGQQTSPAVAFTGSGKYVISWSTTSQFAFNSDVAARRFATCQSSDADGNGKLDVADVFYLINALFAGGPAPVCGGDASGDGKADVADIFYLINFLFAGGPPPVQ